MTKKYNDSFKGGSMKKIIFVIVMLLVVVGCGKDVIGPDISTPMTITFDNPNSELTTITLLDVGNGNCVKQTTNTCVSWPQDGIDKGIYNWKAERNGVLVQTGIINYTY